MLELPLLFPVSNNSETITNNEISKTEISYSLPEKFSSNTLCVLEHITANRNDFNSIEYTERFVPNFLRKFYWYQDRNATNVEIIKNIFNSNFKKGTEFLTWCGFYNDYTGKKNLVSWFGKFLKDKNLTFINKL